MVDEQTAYDDAQAQKMREMTIVPPEQAAKPITPAPGILPPVSLPPSITSPSAAIPGPVQNPPSNYPGNTFPVRAAMGQWPVNPQGEPIPFSRVDKSHPGGIAVPGKVSLTPQGQPITTQPTVHQQVDPFAMLWAKSSNIHNPILRTLAKVGSGLGAAAEGANPRFPAQEEEAMRELAIPGASRAQEAETGLKAAQAGAIGNPKWAEVPGFTSPGGQPAYRDETGKMGGYYTIGQQGYEPIAGPSHPQAAPTAQPAGGTQPIQQQGPAGPQPGQLVPTRSQNPDLAPVPKAQVQSFANDAKADYPSLTPGQVRALANQLGPAPTQADYRNAWAQAEKDSTANESGADRKTAQAGVEAQRAQAGAEREEKDLDTAKNRVIEPLQKRIDKVDDQLEKLNTATSTIAGATEMGDAIGVVKALQGTSGGQGSGIRMSPALLDRIVHARGWKGSVQDFVEHAAGKGTLTPEQRGEIRGILSDVRDYVQERRDIMGHSYDSILDAHSRDEIRQVQKDLNDRLGTQGKTHSFTYGGKSYVDMPEDVFQRFKKLYPDVR